MSIDRVKVQAVIDEFAGNSHQGWCDARRKEGVTNWWRPALPTDTEWCQSEMDRNNPHVRMGAKGWEVDILVAFNKLSPGWQKKNSVAAAATVNLVVAALENGRDLSEPSVLEELAMTEHEMWRERDKYRAGKDPAYDLLDVPYPSIPEEEKEKDRERIRRALARLVE